MNSYLITAVLSATMAFCSGWKIQSWRYGAMETQRVQTNLETERLAGKVRTLAETNVVNAQNRSAARAADARADAADARSELERVRALSDTAIATSRLSHASCLDRTVALSDVFEHCATRYSELGEAATRHANDIQTLNESWPRSDNEISPLATPNVAEQNSHN